VSLLLAVLGAGVLAGWLTGGSLTRLASVQLRGLPVLVGSFAIQVILSYAPSHHWPIPVALGAALHLLSYAMLLYVLWRNLGLRGIAIVTAGVLMNLMVIAANGARMPVTMHVLTATEQADLIPVLQSGADFIHSLSTAQTRLDFLGDCLVIPGWFCRPSAGSPGDFVIMAGLLVFLVYAMKRRDDQDTDAASLLEERAR